MAATTKQGDPIAMSQPVELNYASCQVEQPGDLTPRRYFVYGIDMLTEHTARLQATAFGLTSLAALLQSSKLLPELIVVEPDAAAMPEPPPLDYWLADATAHADSDARARVGAMHHASRHNVPYVLSRPITATDDQRHASLARNVVLVTGADYHVTRSAMPHPEEASRSLASTGLVCGGFNVAVGLIGLLVPLVLTRKIDAATIVIMLGASLLWIAPGTAMLVAGLNDFRRRRWAPIVALVAGVIGTSIAFLSFAGNAGRSDILAAVFSIALFVLNAKYTFRAIRAVAARRPQD